MKVNFEQLLQKSNSIKNYIKEDVASHSNDMLNWKENSKKWSALEVVSHLNRVYEKYHDNFEKAIGSAPELTTDSQIRQRTIIGRLSIYSMKPKRQKRRFKMKTFDFFQPQVDTKNIDATISLFLENKDRFNGYLLKSRSKNLRGIKMPTALGEKMKFYIPECFEFILSHEERHMVQIEGILEMAGIQVID